MNISITYVPIVVVLILMCFMTGFMLRYFYEKPLSTTNTSIKKQSNIVYHLLAISCIITIGISLYVNHSIMKIHDASIQKNLDWASRRDNLVKLSELATAVNAPGNNVFESMNIASETSIRDKSLQEFIIHLQRIESNIHSFQMGKTKQKILSDIANIRSSMSKMVSIQNDIFYLLAKHKIETAGGKMAYMDRNYAELTSIINFLSLEISAIQSKSLIEQLSRAEQLKNMEYYLVALMFLVTVMLALYSHYLFRQRQREFEEKEFWHRNLVDTCPGTCLVLNESGEILYANKACELLLGFSLSDIVNHSINTLMSVEHQYDHVKPLQEFLNDRINLTTNEAVEMIHKNGKKVFVNMGYSILHIDNRKLFQVMIFDIGDRVLAAKMKNELISIFSHEVRTPLTSIRAGIYLLMQPRLSSSKKVELLESTYRNCERLINLINDMLDIEKVESGRANIRRTTSSIHNFINDAINQVRPLIVQKGIDIDFNTHDTNREITTDLQRLNQVMVNLLSNAIKFTESRASKIDISVKSEHEFVHISVIDYGKGVPTEFENFLFEKFTQHESSNTRTQEGTGLGLALCKVYMEALGGSIGYSPNEKGGSIFTIQFPDIS